MNTNLLQISEIENDHFNLLSLKDKLCTECHPSIDLFNLLKRRYKATPVLTENKLLRHVTGNEHHYLAFDIGISLAGKKYTACLHMREKERFYGIFIIDNNQKMGEKNKICFGNAYWGNGVFNLIVGEHQKVINPNKPDLFYLNWLTKEFFDKQLYFEASLLSELIKILSSGEISN
jgi:hypothetical protein